ncbi:MAG: CIS tube protein [Nitrososphaerales archaeon]
MMATRPLTPRTANGSFSVIDTPGNAPKIIVFQYNPDSLHHTITPKLAPADGIGGPNPYRVKGYPVETITLDLEFDATDQLEIPNSNPAAVSLGIYPQLAALQLMMYPSISPEKAGTSSVESPFVVFVWGAKRVVPVALTNCVVIEEAFDADLNPIRAKATITMTVLTTDDLTVNHPGYKIFQDYLNGLRAMAV